MICALVSGAPVVLSVALDRTLRMLVSVGTERPWSARASRLPYSGPEPLGYRYCCRMTGGTFANPYTSCRTRTIRLLPLTFRNAVLSCTPDCLDSCKPATDAHRIQQSQRHDTLETSTCLCVGRVSTSG